ncbi:MAG: ribbon-helix-helix domain-containing protein [Nitrososphaerales archaeon]
MVEKNKVRWNKVNIPQEMLDLIDKYLKTEMAKQRGLTSRSDVAIEAIRKFLEREGMYTPKPRFEHLNTYEDHVKIWDNRLSRTASVYFKEDKVLCDICESDECIHIGFALSIPEVVNALERHGYPILGKVLNKAKEINEKIKD